MDPTAMFAIFCLFGLPVLAAVTVTGMVLTWKLRNKELEVRRLEAQARLSTTALPDWIDANDKDAITDWTLAQRELNRASARAALTQA